MLAAQISRFITRRTSANPSSNTRLFQQRAQYPPLQFFSFCLDQHTAEVPLDQLLFPFSRAIRHPSRVHIPTRKSERERERKGKRPMLERWTLECVTYWYTGRGCRMLNQASACVVSVHIPLVHSISVVRTRTHRVLSLSRCGPMREGFRFIALCLGDRQLLLF